MNADRLRRKQMLHNKKRLEHKESIHRRPKGHRVVEIKEKVQIVDLDKKAAPKEKPGIFRGIFRRMFRRVTGA